jgi:hypothetical protein
MTNRRLAFAGLALVAAIGLSGCGPTEDRAAPAAGSSAARTQDAAQQASPAEDLAAAALKLGEDTVRVDMRMAGSIGMTGVLDPKAQTARMTMDMSALAKGTKVEMRKIGNDMYMKFGGSLGSMLGGGSKWMHVDVAKLADGSSFNIMPSDDPAGAKGLVKAMNGVERVGEHGFKGTIDLTKTPQYSKQALKSLGGKASSVPFTARTDDQGRLVELTVDMTGVTPGAGEMTTRYSDFGVAVDVAKPPVSQVTELPSQLKGMVGA